MSIIHPITYLHSPILTLDLYMPSTLLSNLPFKPRFHKATWYGSVQFVSTVKSCGWHKQNCSVPSPFSSVSSLTFSHCRPFFCLHLLFPVLSQIHHSLSNSAEVSRFHWFKSQRPKVQKQEDHSYIFSARGWDCKFCHSLTLAIFQVNEWTVGDEMYWARVKLKVKASHPELYN